MERRGLGKGLQALITAEAPAAEKEKIVFLNPEIISANRYQPRLAFKEEKLQELVESIREKGVVQPVVVRQNEGGDFELVAGERRLRAVKELGMDSIPALIKNVNDQELLELSIIENIQRDDLNALEEAKAYESLMKDFGFTQEQVAKSVGKNRATIANMLRLLTLPDKVKDALFRELISFGHARAVLSLVSENAQIALTEKIIKQGLSVREAEQAASANKESRAKKQKTKDQNVAQLEEELQHIFGSKVTLFHGRKRGRIQIEYYSLEDLERILNIIRVK